MVETIYIARHGFRANFEAKHWTSVTGTLRDPPLTAHGVFQAKELAAHLTTTLPPSERPDLIISSPYYRCLTTAQPTAEALGLDIWVEDGIGEWYLPAQKGLHPKHLSPTELATYVPKVSPTSHSALLYPSRRGETVTALHNRASTFLQLLLKYLDSHPQQPKKVLLITHAATNIALGRALTGDGERDVRTGCASLGVYERKGDGKVGSWEQTRNGDCSFLSQGEERNWAFSYIEDYIEAGCDLEDDGTESAEFTINPHKDTRNPDGVEENVEAPVMAVGTSKM